MELIDDRLIFVFVAGVLAIIIGMWTIFTSKNEETLRGAVGLVSIFLGILAVMVIGMGFVSDFILASLVH